MTRPPMGEEPSDTTVLDPPPDILLIYVDQWRWDALGALGSQAQTPNLDALASAGVHFDHAFVQSPVCMPSRASLLTGRYPSDLRITQMGIPVPSETETVAKVVQRRGWRTANIGKLHFLPHANRDHASSHPSYGFDLLALSDEPGVYEDDYRAWVRAVDPTALTALSKDLPPAAKIWQDVVGSTQRDTETKTTGARDDYATVQAFTASSRLTHSAWVAHRTIQHLESLQAHQPAFTIASFFSPHPPFNVPTEFLDLYDRQSIRLPDLTDAEKGQQHEQGLSNHQIQTIRHGYYAAISEVDHHIGRILTALDRLGRTNRTLVVLASDHGDQLGDRLRVSKGYPASDPVSRIPLIFRWPDGIASPGRRTPTIIEALDVAPTLLDALGIPAPHTMQGRSLLPNLKGQPLDRVELAITEHDGWRSVRTRNYRYLVHSDGSELLWDVSSDPANETNLADGRAHRATLAEHRRLLIQRMLEAEKSMSRVWPY